MDNLKIKSQVALAKFTTLKIGGPAEWLAQPKNLKELNRLIYWVNKQKIPWHIIGAGSNLLINDNPLKGLSFCMKKYLGYDLDHSSGEIEVFSGELLPKIARKAAEAGLSGLEWAVGIPGTMGGAIAMNAGAQGGCIAERVKSVQVISVKDGKNFELTQNELQFAYRKSLLQKEPLIVLSAKLRLEPGHKYEELNRITNKNLTQRTSTQPYNLPSCGSVFRNPEPLKAGKLIESLGLKGLRVGGAEVSRIHANFIVNTSQASAKDFQDLICIIQNKVKDSHGIFLQPEVKQLGF